MIYLDETFAGDRVSIEVIEHQHEATAVSRYLLTSLANKPLALDTESTSYTGMYRPDWKMRLVQFGTAHRAWVFPAAFRDTVASVLYAKRQWILHNAPHDVLSLDLGLNIKTGLLPWCIDTHIMAHLLDSRPTHEGGLGLGVKDLASSLCNEDADRWEKALKAEFKQITVEVPGEFYKSGNSKLGRKKGDPKRRKITLSEGWRHIDTYNETYLRYSGMDAIMEYRIWQELSKRLEVEYAAA